MNDASKKLDEAAAQIHQRYGSEKLRLPGTPIRTRQDDAFSTSYPMLDKALEVGGIPRANLTVCIGEGSTGVQTMAMRTAANATMQREMVSYLDLNHSFDADYAAQSGVVTANMLIVQPTQENTLAECLHTLLQLGGSGLIVVDAIFTGDSITQREAKMLQSLLRRSSTALLVLTMPRQNDAIIEAADIRIHLECKRLLKRRQEVRGFRTEVRILKNKLVAPAPPVSVSLAIFLSDRNAPV